MLQITKLTGTAAEATWTEPYGITSGVHNEPAPGFIRIIELGSAGVTVRNGSNKVGIPMAEILRLAEQAIPALAPVAATKITPAK